MGLFLGVVKRKMVGYVVCLKKLVKSLF